ncbi:hypothetical protein C0991_004585 [Blastosporella zonata]|nr:hypothetical protein C0991_004585 [Blastosporella zonata]
MVNFTADQVRALMDKPTNTRNMSVIAHAGDGKSTLVDSMARKAGIVANTPYKDTGLDYLQDSSITIKSTVVSMYYELDKGDLASVKQETKGNEFLINLINPVGHVDLSSEVTTALRVSDGALVVVDCIDGLSLQTESVLFQALNERIEPLIVINKVDRALLNLQLSKEDLYQSFSHTISSINTVISALDNSIQIHPSNGAVAFTSALHGWGFTLRQFATRYAHKFGVDKEKMMTKLWGDNFFNPATRKWSTRSTDADGKPLERGFNAFVLEPIFRIFNTVLNLDPTRETIDALCDKLNVDIPEEEKELERKALLKAIMRRFLPCGDSLLEMVVINLPSPITAQRYRVQTLYEGPMDDESALGIRDCNPAGPLVVYVSKMVPTTDKGRFYAFGRVFSGTVRAGVPVRIQGPNYVPGAKVNNDLFIKSIERAVLMNGRYVDPIRDCPAGNVVGLIGIDQFLLKSGTITSAESAFNMRVMRFSVSPVVQVAVEVKNPTDLPKLVEGLKRLSKADPCVRAWVSEETGEHIVAGAGELHLEVCLKVCTCSFVESVSVMNSLSQDLENDYAYVPFTTSDPYVTHRETIRAESRIVALAKSQNRHNRLYVSAAPLSADLIKSIEDGTITGPTSRSGDPDFSRVLKEDFGWDISEARRIWAFGPEGGPNVLVDATKGVQYIGEIRDACVAGMRWAVKEGVCAEEKVRGVRLNIMDVMMNSDAIHRGSGQIIPTMRRACYAASLLADPAIQEPIFLVEIQCPESAIGSVYGCLNNRGGKVLSEAKRTGTPVFIIKAYLPVSESFGFDAELRDETAGQAFAHSVFDHWEMVDGSPLEKGSKAEEIVVQIRTRKGLKPEIPSLETYCDKL